jgi:ABC-2 type transport system permease protein
MLLLIIKYQWRLLTRNRFQISALLLTFLLGTYSIYYGCSEINKQKEAIQLIQQQTLKQRKIIKAGFFADTTNTIGKQAYQIAALPAFNWHRHQYDVVLKPSALAGLSIGQRDLQPFYYTLTGMSLYYQIFQNEIANPQKLLVGNFDLSFVIIYLFPLLIVSFCYNLIASERGNGIIALLRSQAYPIHRIILYRMLLYLFIILCLALLLNIIGFIACGATLKANGVVMLFWLMAVSFYLLFWFALVLFIISFNYNSSLSAICSIGSWLLLLIIIPAVINIAVTLKHPLNSNLLSGISRRTGVFDEEVDANQLRIVKKFLKTYPQYDKHNLVSKNLHAKGFAAYTALNDLQSAQLVAKYQAKVTKREILASKYKLINPAVTVQNLFDCLAGTGLSNFQDFYRSTVSFHQQLLNFYYPKLFANQAFTLKDYQQAPKFEHTNHKFSIKPIILILVQIFTTFSIVIVIGYLMIKKKLNTAN